MKNLKDYLSILLLSLSFLAFSLFFSFPFSSSLQAKSVSISTLIKNLKSSSTKKVKKSIYYLLLVGDRAVPRLISALANDSRKIADNSARVLSKMKRPEQKVIPALLRAMKSKKTSVRINAAWTLSMIKKPSVIALTTLIRALKDKNKTVRFHAVWALIELKAKAEKALPSLKRLRRDKDFYVKDSARYAICHIRKAISGHSHCVEAFNKPEIW